MYAPETAPEMTPTKIAMPGLLKIGAVDPRDTPPVIAPIITSLKPILLLSARPRTALPMYTPTVLPDIAQKILNAA